jgi:hypothetical protein
MSAYNPPSESITEFNTSLFNQPEQILSQAEADKLYLSKTKNDTSTATLTTFNNAVSVGGNFSITAIKSATTAGANVLFDNMTTSGVLTIGNSLSTNQIYGVSQFNQNLYCASINCSNYLATNSTTNTNIGTNLTTGTLTISGTGATNVINGNTTFPQNVTAGTNGASNNLSINGELRCYDTASPYTSYARISTTGTTTIWESANVANSSHVFKLYNSAGLITSPAPFEITASSATGTISRQLITLTGRLNFSNSTYSFPFSSNTSLGYVLKNTGTSTSITSATATTLSTISIPIGVWRVDYAVQNTVATAGTITAAQSYVATSANPTTQLLLTGSLVRSHISEVYTAGDVQVITSSFTLSVSTAQNYVLTILRTFATGAYNLTGEISVTRIA